MALWIHNITPGGPNTRSKNLYAVKVNTKELVRFEHRRSSGAAECFRAAADALDAAGAQIPHDHTEAVCDCGADAYQQARCVLDDCGFCVRETWC